MKRLLLTAIIWLCASTVWAAMPVILVNATGGSDTAASGAGPATALTGSAAATDGGGTTVTVDSGADLTGVATDGSAVIYLIDTTPGHRRFSKITGTNNGAHTVAVNEAFTGTLSGITWAIGGKRATVGSATSALLLNNNNAAGDAMPGWAIEMQSGHTEADIAANLIFKRAGDVTSGPIILRGTLGAATMPILQFSNNGSAITTAVGTAIRDFEIKNSNGTKTASYGVNFGTNSMAERMRINDAAKKFFVGISMGGGGIAVDNEVGNTASDGIQVGNSQAIGNWIHGCAGHGIGGNGLNNCIMHNLITGCTGDGIHITTASNGLAKFYGPVIIGNTVDANTGDGLEFTAASTNADVFAGTLIQNNIFSNNTGYGMNFSGANVNQNTFSAYGCHLRGNVMYANGSSNVINSAAPTIADEYPTTTNPTYTSTGGNDYSVGSNMKAKGYPAAATRTVGIGSSTSSYIDPGCAQRVEPSGSTTYSRSRAVNAQ